MKRRFSAQWRVGPTSRIVSTTITSLLGLGLASAQQATPPADPTAPLRHFPITMLVRRPSLGLKPISILRLNTLLPNDEVLVSVDDRLKGNWTLVAASVGAGQKIRIKSWNLWDKRITKGPIDTGKIPDSDVVPLYFLVLNKPKEHRVFDGIRHALETSSEQIVSQTAIFQTKYTQQNRLLNFMTAYAELGPRVCPDPNSLKNRVDLINYDLGAGYDPTLQYSSPGQLQHGLDAGVGVLDAMRQSPDNPTPAAAVVRGQLPGVVSDWVSLVGDLMHVFIKPPHDVKLTFVPASAVSPQQADPKNGKDSLELVTQRVLETTDNSLPALVYRPPFARQDPSRPIRLTTARTEVLANSREVAIPLGTECRDLYVNDWAWDWQVSVDGQPFVPIVGAHLVPGRGLVFPIAPDWWGGVNSHKLFIKAKIGFDSQESRQVIVGRVSPQTWAAQELAASDCATGDPSVSIRFKHTGPEQPFFRYSAVYLKDSTGHIVSADNVGDREPLVARFNLTSVAPGTAQVFVDQEEAESPDQPVNVFIAPKHPNISIFCGKGDKVLRISGPESAWVKSVELPSLFIKETDDSEAGTRLLTLSGPLPAEVKSAVVTFHDPAHGLEWTHSEPISVGLPRPRVIPSVVGTVPTSLAIGAGSDPNWAMATLPAGWVRSKQPLRIGLQAISSFVWSHDVSVEVGFGSSGDVQSALTFPEGPNFAFDGSTPDAYLTVGFETMLPPNARRNSGLVWVKVDRSDLSSPWTLVTTKGDAGPVPIRAVKVPTIVSIATVGNETVVTLSGAEQVLGAKFTGQQTFIPPQLLESAPGNLNATITGPANATEFDLQLRDAAEGVIHVKITKP